MKERKKLEVEHSDRRRSIVTGYEYKTDAGGEDIKIDHIEKDDDYSEHFSNMRFYSVTAASFKYRDKLLYSDIKGVTALDYCCGNGEIGSEMAAKGANKVLGIDLSPVAIENAGKLAEKNSVQDKCKFAVGDAENTEFADNTFDIIHEYGSLHHLDLEAAYKELARILKPGGKVVCTEALRHNPLIHNYRKRTPVLRTKWEVEHILGVPEILLGRKYFKDVKIRFFHLAALVTVPFRKTVLFRPLLFIFEFIDSILLRIPYLQRLAWIAVIEYKNPK